MTGNCRAADLGLSREVGLEGQLGDGGRWPGAGGRARGAWGAGALAILTTFTTWQY